MLVISGLRGQRQKDYCKFGSILGYMTVFQANLYLCLNDGTFCCVFTLWGTEVNAFQAFYSISMVSLSHS